MRLLRLLKKDLAKEAGGWVEEGIVDESQANRILSKYGATLSDAAGMSVGYWALTALAVLFAGLSLIVFISANWDDIPRAVRMGALILLTVLTGAAGAAQFVRGKKNAGVLWLFFGGISYGVSIMLIAQIYHLGEHYPDGIFFWMLGVWPLVFCTQSRLIGLLTLVLATIWMLVETVENFFPWAYPIIAATCLWLVIFRKPSTSLFMGATFGLVTWVHLLIAWHLAGGRNFRATDGMLPFGIAVSLFLLGLAHWMMHRKEWLKDYGLVMSLWLMRGLLVFMVIFSFEAVWQEFDSVHLRDWVLMGTVPVLGLAGWGLSRSRKHGESHILLPLGVLLSGAFALAYTGSSLWAAVCINLLLLVSGIWLIRRGVDEGATHYYYTGILVLLVTALCRYFDLIGDYVGASLMFLVAAAILFVSARFWKKRMSRQTKERQDGELSK